MALGIDDLGFLQGVTAVERLRTWSGQLPLLDEHLRRFQHTAETLKIVGLPTAEQLADLMRQLRTHNATDSDTGIVIFATPGRRPSTGSPVAPNNAAPNNADSVTLAGTQPTLGIHCSPLDFPRLERLRRDGQPLVITDVRQPPLDCWPRDIKVRCRIHYYLADQQAREHDPEAGGVLIDDDSSITETSTANVLAVFGNRLVIPPAGRVLPGVMLQTVCRLAEQEGLEIERRPIAAEMLTEADEVLLTGSEAGLWPASKIDGTPKPIGLICRRLQASLARHLQQS